MAFDRNAAATKLAALAAQGIYIGTSSWKYAGWRSRLYDEARYIWRGKFAESRFDKNCLTEYSEVFHAVGVDSTFYSFPKEEALEGLASQVPADFQFGFKVTEEITVKHFPNHPRAGARGGRANENFLNADLFGRAFLTPCERIRSHVGIVMFEFARFHSGDYVKGADFIADLDGFLARLPEGWPYGIELRNQTWLVPEYFACLARHGVTHVFNSWSAMPPVSEQMSLASSRTNPELTAARFLLKPGRKYEDAVKMFSPYDKLVEVNEEARQAAAKLIAEAKVKKRGKTLIFVNNRLEGCALDSIASMLTMESDNDSSAG